MATINAWNVPIPVPIGFGGTQQTTFTSNSLVIGNGTGPLTSTNAGTNGEVMLGATAASPAFGTLTSTGGTISFTTGANTLNLETSGGGFTTSWVEVTGATQAMAINTAYIANRGTLITFTLPTTAAVGSIVRVVGKGAGGWTINYTTNQIIHFGAVDTTITTGSMSSSQQYDAVELVCTVANTTFTVASGPQGNLTYI